MRTTKSDRQQKQQQQNEQLSDYSVSVIVCNDLTIQIRLMITEIRENKTQCVQSQSLISNRLIETLITIDVLIK